MAEAPIMSEHRKGKSLDRSSVAVCAGGSPVPLDEPYRGRLAPSPTGWLHLGHARTFWTAQERARRFGGRLVLRIEDLDAPRCRAHFATGIIEDLCWFGIEWEEGPDRGGPFGPYNQSERGAHYLAAIRKLASGGFIYPCTCSRRDVLAASRAPQGGEDEPLYSGRCRPGAGAVPAGADWPSLASGDTVGRARVNWRFRVPDGESVSFVDGHFGPQRFVAGVDFGDFVLWRHDGLPAYQLVVVVDDAAMRITEVVRGADLLKSTARQILLYRALGLKPPAFHHCPLVTDENGNRLAKRHDALSLRQLRAVGRTPAELRAAWGLPGEE
jgi:glutamyl/glutaminyl-tRNA synthetase